LALVVLAVASCQSSNRPPAIEAGRECARCGMTIGGLRFACEAQDAHGWRQYDSIECLVGDQVRGPAWLADYDSRGLVPSESLWVVKGDFPSPMGGGLAAFRDRAAADDIASRTHGRVGRLAEVAPGRENPS
jgi:nitrous oxide reductase accessory protein NosL